MREFLKKNEVDQIYLYELMKKFAFGLISVFIPVYILSNTGSVHLTFIYLLGYVAVFWFSSIPGAYVISRIGFKHSLAISYFFFLPAFLMLRYMSLEILVVSGIAVLIGFGKMFHWVALHAEFAVDSSAGSRGRAAGRLLGLPKIASTAAPFIGGTLMAIYGFSLLVSVAIIFMFLSAVPLAFSRDHRDPMEYGFIDFLDQDHAELGALFFLRGIALTTGAFLFPLYVFHIVGDVVSVGSVKSLMSLGGIFFALFLGRLTDRVDRSKMIMFGAVGSATIFLLKSGISNSIEAFFLSTLGGLLFMVYYVPLYSRFADMAEKEDILEFYTFREFCLAIGKMFVLLVTFLVALKLSLEDGLRVAILMAAVAEGIIPLVIKGLDWNENC